MAFIIGLGVEYKNCFKGCFTFCVILGTCINYLFGVVMFCIIMHSTVWVALTACVLPFIPTAILKALLASILGLNLRKRVSGLS
ncbi:MAG: biotin transporter BioY [Coprococcus phoceensis]